MFKSKLLSGVDSDGLDLTLLCKIVDSKHVNSLGKNDSNDTALGRNRCYAGLILKAVGYVSTVGSVACLDNNGLNALALKDKTTLAREL